MSYLRKHIHNFHEFGIWNPTFGEYILVPDKMICKYKECLKIVDKPKEEELEEVEE